MARSAALQTALVATALAITACNSPSRAPCSPPPGPGELGSICGFSGPEDLEYVRKVGLVVVSNLRWSSDPVRGGGFLAGFEPGPSPEVVRLWPGPRGAPSEPEPGLGEAGCTEPPPANAFAPHGITADLVDGERQLLYVAAHASAGRSREAIEIFELRGRGVDTTVVWKACIPTPGDVQANDLALTPDGAIVASNYQPDGSLRHMLFSALFGTRTGDIMVWSKAEGWTTVPGTEAKMANGVAVSRRGENLLFAETMTGEVRRVPIDGGGGAIAIHVGGNPDNFTRTPRDTLLLATHTGGAAFLLCSFGKAPCTTAWKVVEIDPDTLAMRDVYEHDGSAVGAVATALELDGFLYFGSVFDDRIGVLEIAPR